MKIAVLAGGLTTERDVSLRSGKDIHKALIQKGHKAILIDVFLGYEGMIDDAEVLFEKCADLTGSAAITEKIPNLTEIKNMRKLKSDSYFGENVIKLCQYADICFLGLHGGEGENGQIQAAFDMLGIKYTGTDFLSAATAMAKHITKDMFISSNVPTAESILFKPDSNYEDFDKFPCVVKPCSAGSSVGVNIAHNKEEFLEAMKEAFSYEDFVLVEKHIKGREFSVGVIDGKAVPVIEIIPKEGWFDYKNKYQDGVTKEVCPAKIPGHISEKMQREAEHVAKVLSLKVYCRIDFILEDDTEDIYCLEANTLPGMTPSSLLPKEAHAMGWDYPELCDKIVNLSLKKYKDKIK